MKCHEVEQAIIEQDTLGAEARRHLETCASCRRFQELHTLVLHQEPRQTPPRTLDHAILAAARRHGRRRITPRRFLRLMIPAAAAALLLAGVLSVTLFNRPDSKTVAVRVDAPDVDADATDTLSPWTTAVMELDIMDDELDGMLEEFSVESPIGSADGNHGTDSDENLDPLLELELDVYFESQRLRIDG